MDPQLANCRHKTFNAVVKVAHPFVLEIPIRLVNGRLQRCATRSRSVEKQASR
jgi:hypothetical protein